MKFLKRVILLLCSVLLSSSLFSQKTEFNKKGKITSIGVKDFKIADADAANITSLSNKVQEDFREILKKQIDETKKRLEDPSDNLKSFYVTLWGRASIDNIIQDLNNISTAIKDKSFTGLSLTVLTQIQPLLETHLLNTPTTYKIYEFTNSGNEGKLKYINPFNKFIISHYNGVYSGSSAAIKTFDLKKWSEYIQYFSEQSKRAEQLLDIIWAKNGTVTMKEFLELVKFHQQLTISRGYTFMNDPWFKNWIWIRSGTLRLNPLDFTTDAFLEKFPEYDVTKSEIYERYLDSVIKKYTLYDTVGKIDHFKKLLNEKGTGKDQFKLKNRIDEMAANAKKMEEQLTVTRVLNEVNIPEFEITDFSLRKGGTAKMTIENPSEIRKFLTSTNREGQRKIRGRYYFHNYSYSAKDNFKSETHKEFLTDPLRTGAIKKFAVHNIPAGYDVDFLVKSTPIIDRSNFQEGTDTILGIAAELSKWMTQFSSFTNFVPTAKAANTIIEAHSATLGGAGARRITIKERIQLIMNGGVTNPIYDEYEGLFYQETFNLVSNKREFLNNMNATFTNTTAQNEFIRLFLIDYKTELEILQKHYFEVVQNDSLMLTFLIPVFANSSLPPAALKEKENDIAVYHSKVLSTEPNDSPVKNELQLVGFKGTDTSKIGQKFAYKVGKNYRFQLSAGIAYTFKDYIQSKAEEKDGKIAITNTAQNYRLIVGVHVHFGKGLFLQDNRFLGRFSERSSFYLGVGIPKPLENVYTGLGYDLVPGLKITAGVHIYRNDKYTIQNNSIIEQRMQYKYAGPFAAIEIDPSSLLKALNIINAK